MRDDPEFKMDDQHALALLARAAHDIKAVRTYVEARDGWADLGHSARVTLARLDEDVTYAVAFLPDILSMVRASSRDTPAV
jgi:hypothetical protein